MIRYKKKNLFNLFYKKKKRMSFTEILNRIEYLIHLIEMMIKLYHEANEEPSDEDITHD